MHCWPGRPERTRGLPVEYVGGAGWFDGPHTWWVAASSGKCTTTYGHSLPPQAPEWSSLVGFVSVGGVPKTGHASFSDEMGGDPTTDHVSFGDDTGGDPRTDHASLCASESRARAATCSPYRPGLLATQTAFSDPVSTGLVSSPTVSRSSYPEDRDEFPIYGDLQGQAHSEALNSTSDTEHTAISRVLRIAEKSEELRQSDFGVQNLPASGSSSELSAHQMGASLMLLIQNDSMGPPILQGMQTT